MFNSGIIHASILLQRIDNWRDFVYFGIHQQRTTEINSGG